jgi:hypothetical protein
MIVSFQVTEAIKILTGNFDRVSRKMLHVDVWTNEIHQLDVETAWERGDCPCCKGRRFDYLEGKAGSSAAVLCGRDAVQLRPRQEAGAVDLAALARRLEGHGSVDANEFLLRAHITDGNKPYELTLFPNGRAIIKGTQEPEIARSIYSKYIGT